MLTVHRKKFSYLEFLLCIEQASRRIMLNSKYVKNYSQLISARGPAKTGIWDMAGTKDYHFTKHTSVSLKLGSWRTKFNIFSKKFDFVCVRSLWQAVYWTAQADEWTAYPYATDYIHIKFKNYCDKNVFYSKIYMW